MTKVDDVVEALRSMIDIRDSGQVLIDAPYTRLNIVVIGIIKYASTVLNRSVVYVSADKPYIYVKRLMAANNVPEDAVIFIDTVSNISSEPVPKEKNVEVLDNPFCMTALEKLGDAIRKYWDEQSSIVLIDNPQTLVSYIEMDCIADILLKVVLKIGENVTSLYVLDKNLNPELYEQLRTICNEEKSLRALI